jgi:hypothetical protein
MLIFPMLVSIAALAAPSSMLSADVVQLEVPLMNRTPLQVIRRSLEKLPDDTLKLRFEETKWDPARDEVLVLPDFERRMLILRGREQRVAALPELIRFFDVKSARLAFDMQVEIPEVGYAAQFTATSENNDPWKVSAEEIGFTAEVRGRINADGTVTVSLGLGYGEKEVAVVARVQDQFVVVHSDRWGAFSPRVARRYFESGIESGLYMKSPVGIRLMLSARVDEGPGQASKD